MRIALLIFSCCCLLGCATTSNNPDPYESFNRSVYSFNRTLDKSIVKPVTYGYKYITPDPVEKGVSNFFDNLGDIGNLINNILQFKLGDALSDLGRFIVNSSLGIGGLFDPATAMGLEKHNEDFGQTLASWGIDSGPYIMLPFFGPSTLRDVSGLPADNYWDPVRYLEDNSARAGMSVIRLIDTRSSLLSLEGQLNNVADEYLFVRDAYLQNRRFEIYDGNLPLDDFDCDPEYEDCDDEEELDEDEASDDGVLDKKATDKKTTGSN